MIQSFRHWCTQHPLSCIFIGVLVAGFFIQSLVWTVTRPVDQAWWVRQIKNFSQIVPGKPNQPDTATIYPGTTIIGVAKVAQALGVDSEIFSLQLSISFWTALAAAISAAACRALGRSWWWLAVAGILLLNHIYILATPATTVVTGLLTAAFLLIWNVHQPGKSASQKLILASALTIGLAGATRADITAILMLPLLIFQYRSIGIRKTITILVLAAVVFIAADPFFWESPMGQIRDLVIKTQDFYFPSATSGNAITSTQIIEHGFLAFLGLGIGLVILIARRAQTMHVRYAWLWATIGMTACALGILLTSESQALRYYAPLIVIWETLLAYFMARGLEQKLPRAGFWAAVFLICIQVALRALV